MNTSCCQDWRNLHRFDRLYARHLKAFYAEVEERASTTWPGMELCPVCIFRPNGPAFLYGHPDPPPSLFDVGDGLWLADQAALQLFGATQAEIGGVLTAINSYDLQDYPLELFYAELFHEMHHVYQRNRMPSFRYDDPALLVTYPEIVENDALKLLEGGLLLQMVLGHDQQTLADKINTFFSARDKRQQIIGSQYLDMEKRAESMEGPAVYCQYRYLQSRQQTSWDRALFTVARYHEFLSGLTRLMVGRQELRSRLLMTGLAQCLILAKCDIPNWEQAYVDSDALLSDFLFDQLPIRRTIIPETDELRAYASYYLEREQEERQRRVEALEDQDGIRVEVSFGTTPECRGIDPMTAEAIDPNTVIHNTMLKLGRDDNLLSFLDGGVVAETGENVWEVHSLVLFLKNREQLEIGAGIASVNLDNRHMRWRGEITYESEGKVFLKLE